MYRHCIYCHTDFGANESVEALPIGRRLAFDEARGRLWVVCARCERWNLTPFDTRWEAIESCERLFRASRLRVSSDNIGLAQVGDGIELVRIGSPLRAELASWRYGDQFGRRRKRSMYVGGAAVAGIGAVALGLSAVGVGIGAFAGMWGSVYHSIIERAYRVRIPAADGSGLVYLSPRHAGQARFSLDGPGDSLALSVRGGKKEQRYEGDQALVMASIVLPRVNYAGATKTDVQDAVQVATEVFARGPEDPVGAVFGERLSLNPRGFSIWRLPTPQRLALEMLLHEDDEHRALAGELKELELRWRAAEEIAAIADSLTIPESVEAQFRTLKSRTR